MAQSAGYSLLSTTRMDPQLLCNDWNANTDSGGPSPYLLLPYHRDRLLQAAQLHGWSVHPQELSQIMLEKHCKDALAAAGWSPDEAAPAGRSFRIRILLSRAGAFSVTAGPTAPLPIADPMTPSLWLPTNSSQDPPLFGWNLLLLLPDTVPTPSSLFTRTKTTCRDVYTTARERFGLPPLPTTSPLEVILYNEHGDITETSIRNIAFVRRNPSQWVTPATSSGCLPGVVRRWLLEQGRITEAEEGELRRSDIVDGEYVLTFNGVEGCRLGRVKMVPHDII